LTEFPNILKAVEDLGHNLNTFFATQEWKKEFESTIWTDYEVSLRKLEQKFHAMSDQLGGSGVSDSRND
jgi:hypothetical protein